MQKKRLIFILVLLSIGALLFWYSRQNTQADWSGYQLVSIKSSSDSTLQKGYFYKSTSHTPMPLVVSLHSWRGHYASLDSIALLCKKLNINYIHPDFRGPNNTKEACLSKLALTDIDDAIDYALKESSADPKQIYVIGNSGGGYATLGTYMQSKHYINTFSAWASITDLATWYHESQPKKNNYDKDVFVCTESMDTLNLENAKQRSPLYMQTPAEQRSNSKLLIYAGVHDGIDGSVPFTHSINIYNKILGDMKVSDSSFYVTQQELKVLKKLRKPLTPAGKILDRAICIKKEYQNIKLVVFDGGHEMFHRFAFEELIRVGAVTNQSN